MGSPAKSSKTVEKVWLRARRPEQKAERREKILAAARTLLDRSGAEDATLSAIAREAGLSKANCYRYFESREAILLEVVLDEYRAWNQELASHLTPLADSDDFKAVANAFVDSTLARPRVSKLVASLWSVLERNVGEEGIADFKRRFLTDLAASREIIAAALPSLPDEKARQFLSFFFLFVAGAWPAGHPAPIVRKVMERDEFSGSAMSFELTLRMHASALLRGLADGT